MALHIVTHKTFNAINFYCVTEAFFTEHQTNSRPAWKFDLTLCLHETAQYFRSVHMGQRLCCSKRWSLCSHHTGQILLLYQLKLWPLFWRLNFGRVRVVPCEQNTWSHEYSTGQQGCALRKIEGSPELWNCEIQAAQHMIWMKKVRFSSRPRAKVKCQGPLGSARAQPWSRICPVVYECMQPDY